MTKELPDVLNRILSDACEDYTGLYEILWSLNTAYPEMSEKTKLDVAREALSDLVMRGLVELFTATWPPQSYTSVPSSNAFSAIAADSSWAPPPEPPAVFYAFAATPAGEQAYQVTGANRP